VAATITLTDKMEIMVSILLLLLVPDDAFLEGSCSYELSLRDQIVGVGRIPLDFPATESAKCLGESLLQLVAS
jgi:hypothetical protein